MGVAIESRRPTDHTRASKTNSTALVVGPVDDLRCNTFMDSIFSNTKSSTPLRSKHSIDQRTTKQITMWKGGASSPGRLKMCLRNPIHESEHDGKSLPKFPHVIDSVGFLNVVFNVDEMNIIKQTSWVRWKKKQSHVVQVCSRAIWH